MSERIYLVGLPVGISVADDGTVTAEVYLEEADDLEIENDNDQGITRDQMLADAVTISDAYNTGTIVVTHNQPERSP